MGSPGWLFSVTSLGLTPLPPEPLFAVSPSAYEARALVAQIFGVNPGQVALRLCPEGTRPPRDALIYRLEPGTRPIGDRWILYRGR